jgi:hypothetical protein
VYVLDLAMQGTSNQVKGRFRWLRWRRPWIGSRNGMTRNKWPHVEPTVVSRTSVVECPKSEVRVQGTVNHNPTDLQVRTTKGGELEYVPEWYAELTQSPRKGIVTEPTNYTKLSKKITRRSRQFSELKPV